MITSVRFENFKSLRDVTIDLERFTVLVGANGSGKSSVLQGTRLLTSFFEQWEHPGSTLGRARQVFSAPNTPERLVFGGARSLVLALSEQTFGSFSCRWTRPEESLRAQAMYPEPELFRLTYACPPEHRELSYPTNMASDQNKFFEGLPALRPAVLLRLDPEFLAEAHYSDEPDPHLGVDGNGLAPTLQKLQVLRDGRFERIEASLRRVVPSILRLRAVPAPVKRRERQRVSVDGQDFTSTVERERIGARVQAEVRGGGWIDADLLSEGTLLSLALLTVLQDEQPSLLLLDDLDHALHPLAQGRLIAELRGIQAEVPGLQIVTTTHSPFVVDHCTIKEVRVIRLMEDGSSRCLPLSAHPRWERRKGFMKPGEFWSGVGESWIGE